MADSREGSLALHRRAEVWCGRAECFGVRGKPDVARWCWRRAAQHEASALERLELERPERIRTRWIIATSAAWLYRRAGDEVEASRWFERADAIRGRTV